MENMQSLPGLLAHLGLDLAAVTLLTFGIFYPRHRRRELVPAYLALNVSLFAVVAALARGGMAGGAGGGLAVGFGLFGVVSIIRLRSDTVQHQEVAYYFTTLVLGLLCGLPGLGLGTTAALAGVLLLVVYAADHPRLYSRDRRTMVTLDVVHREPDALRDDLAERLGEPLGWTVQEVDYVRDLMVLEVRFRQPEREAGWRRSSSSSGSGSSGSSGGTGSSSGSRRSTGMNRVPSPRRKEIA